MADLMCRDCSYKACNNNNNNNNNRWKIRWTNRYHAQTKKQISDKSKEKVKTDRQADGRTGTAMQPDKQINEYHNTQTGKLIS